MKDHLDAILMQKGRKVHSIPPLTTVEEAVRIMVNERIGSLLVLDGPRLIGIFTERDALCRVLHVGRDPKTTMITQVMTSNPVTVSPWATVEEAMVIMTERHFRRLPVVAEGKVLGLISIGDLTKWVVRDNEQLVGYITGTYPG
jgi:CBS domain-containing protein